MRTPPNVVQRPSQFLAAALFSWWIITSQSWGQTHDAPFGLYHVFPTPGSFEHCTPLTPPPSATFVLWNKGSTSVTIAEFDSAATTMSYRIRVAPLRFDSILLEDLNGDGRKDFVFVNELERRIAIVVDGTLDSLTAWSVVTPPMVPVGVLVGDINNDRMPDILVYDRESPGIVPYFGRETGAFRQGKVIYPEMSAGEAILAQLNNDGILDLVVYDWVKSEIHFLYGVGLGAFLDQASLPVGGDVKKIFALPLNLRGYLDLALSVQNHSRVEVWKGDGLGDFHLESRVPFKKQTVDLLFADVTKNGLSDLLRLARPASLGVFFNAGLEFTAEGEEFSAGADPVAVLVDDLTRDGLADALVLDREGKQLLLLESGSRPATLRDSLEFVAGVRPRGIVLEDFNQDGRLDIALVNGGTSSLSLFLNQGEGGLVRQSSFMLADNPRYLGFHSVVDSVARFIVSYPQSDQLSFFTLDLRDHSTVNYVIPNTGEAELLYWDQNTEGLISFFAYNSSTTKTLPALAFFQQLGPQRFIERNFRLSIPNALLAASVSDLNNDGFVDVSYLFRNSQGKYEFAVALGDSGLSFRQKVFSYELTEPQIQKSYFWSTDCTGDGNPDILIAFPQHVKMLSLVRGKGNGTFHQPDTVAVGIQIGDRSQLQLLDFDRDGAIDIVLHEMSRSAIGWLRGKGDGTFEEFQPLLHVPAASHFAVGDLTGDGVHDVAVSDAQKGTLRLYNGKLLLRKGGV